MIAGSEAPGAVLARYSLAAARPEPLTGGMINRVWRVETPDGVFVLKQYLSADLAQIQQGIAVQQAASTQGLPVPAVIPDRGAAGVVVEGGRTYVLSHFVPGRLYEPGRIPARAARRMGEALGCLHAALASLSPGDAPSLPTLDAIEAQLRSLLAIARSRQDDPVDAVAEAVLEAKLDLLSRIERVPDMTVQWTHGDFEWRNVLFDDGDEVAAVIDFDNAAYYPPERDVMRCIALTFPALEPEVDFFFEGYAAARKVSPRDAASYVELYRYLSTFRVWPISERYLRPDRYQPRWDALIQPFVTWDWQALTDRLTEAAVRAGELGAPDSVS